MLRDLVKEGGLYTVANLLTKGVSLLLIPFYTVYFSPADYGVIDIINLSSLFITAVIGLQLNQGLARFVAEPTMSRHQNKTFASTAIWTSVFLFCTASLVFLCFPEFFVDLLSSDTKINPKTFQLAVVVFLLNSVFYLLAVHLRFLRMSRPFTIISFLHASLSIVLILLLVLVYDLGIDSIYISYILILPPLIAVQFYLLRKEIIATFSHRALYKLLSFSTPLIPAAIAIMFMNFTDRVFIKQYLNFNELGIYAMGTKFASFVAVMVSGFNMALMPLVYQKYRNETTRNELSRFLEIYVAFGSIGVLILSLFSTEVLHIFAHPNFYSSGEVMPYMFYTAFLVGFSMFSIGLNIEKKTKLTAVIVIVFAAFNILLNFILMPRYGLSGAAIATLIANGFYQLSHFLIARKYYDYPVNFSKNIFVLTTFILLLFFMIRFMPSEISFENILIKLLVILAYSVMLYFTKMLNLDLVAKLFKR